jgi:hypothetical protein
MILHTSIVAKFVNITFSETALIYCFASKENRRGLQFRNLITIKMGCLYKKKKKKKEQKSNE